MRTLLYPPSSRKSLEQITFRLSQQVVEAVRHLHSHKVIHGDLGCHNILVKSDESLALADFGGSSVNGSECLQFPPAYYARLEMGQYDSELSVRDDIFALGTILYEINSGQLLWRDLDDSEIQSRFVKRQYPEFVGMPIALRSIIIRCWMGRYASVDEVVQDLENSGALLDTSSSRGLVTLGLLVTLTAVMVIRTYRRGL